MAEYRKGFLLSILIVVFFVCLIRFPYDDGLRHIGLAFTSGKSWGDTYPYSYFETFKDYDPWDGYDLALRGAAWLIDLLLLSRLLSQFLLAKIILFIFLLAFLYLCLARSGILEEINDGYSFALAYIILILVLGHSLIRISFIRPFAFGTIYLLYTVGQAGAVRGALSSAVLLVLYPYLAWFYTVPAAIAHYLKGDKGFALATISATLITLLLETSSFWGFQAALYYSDSIRGLLDRKITEFAPFTEHLFLYTLYLAGLLVLYPLFSRETKKLNYPGLLLLIYLLPALKYVRYFLDIILPLLFVLYGKEALRATRKGFCGVVSYWTSIMPVPGLSQGKTASYTNSSKARGGMTLKPIIAVLYAIVFAIMIRHNWGQFASSEKILMALSDIPVGAMVLTDFSSQYKALYARPDLRLVPSCEIGFPQGGIEEEYIQFFNKGKVCNLARKIRAKYFIEGKKLYLDPENTGCLEPVRTTRDLRVWKVKDNSK